MLASKGEMTPPCGVPDRGRLEHALLHHPGLEKSFDQIENVAVGHFGSHACHDDCVREVVKEPLDVGVEHMGVPLPMEFQDPLHGHMAAACRPEAIRVVVKQPLEERAQEEPKHLLSNPVADGGDPQRACLARSLGDMDAPQGEGLESPVLQVAHQGQQVLFEVDLEHRDADLVNPRRPAIPPDVAEGEMHEGRGDPSRQRVVLDLGHKRPFPAEPHETETSETTATSRRGGCFLASRRCLRRGRAALCGPDVAD